MVVQLAVLHAADLLVLREERLVPSLHVNDGEPSRSERHSGCTMGAPIVGTAVSHDVRHAIKLVLIDDAPQGPRTWTTPQMPHIASS